jgi:hypothetical protein
LALVRIGFSVKDIRGMTMRDFIAYTDLAFADGTSGGGVRDATQEDIDKLLG